MTRTQDGRLLARQLREALHERAEGEAFEIAVLAGLLSRAGAADEEARAALEEAQRLRDEGLLSADFPTDAQIDAVADRIAVVDEETVEAERADALWELDELCAGAWFCGRGAEAEDAVDLAARTIEAFPRPFQELAELASAVLAKVPPLPRDPARRLWRAVEATALEVQRDDEPARPPPCDEARRLLGLLRRVSLRAVAEQAPLLASGLPPEPELVPLVAEETLQVALGVDPEAGRVLLLKVRGGGEAPQLLCAGQLVPLRDLREGLWRVAARVGVYQVRLGHAEHFFEVAE